ncbi:MAG: hypothetical protein AB8B53_12815 [Flavobacteriales bacterium]
MKLISLILVTGIVFGLSLNSFIVAHFEYNYDYIVTELCVEKDVKDSCCKGSCQLSEELSKADQSSHKEDASALPTLEVLNWFKAESSFKHNVTKINLTEKVQCPSFNLCSGISNSIDHPPRA